MVGAAERRTLAIPRALRALLAAAAVAFVLAASAASAQAATYTLRPDTNVSNQWLVTGAPANWDAINDAVNQPTSVSSTDYIFSGGTGNVSEVGLTTRALSGETPQSGTAWFYGNTASTTQVKMEVVWSGAVRATYTLAAGATFGWRSVSVTPPTQAAIDDLRLRFTTVGGPDANVRAAYFDLVTAGDTTPPDTSITSAPPASTASTSASFSFTSTETNSTFECKLDAGAYGACTSPKSYAAGLATGSHTFSVRAKDVAGNVDPTPATYTWTITGCTPSLGSFGVDSWPPACWRPYADTSPFNRQLPATLTSAQIDPNSANVVARVTGWGLPAKLAAGYQGTSQDWAHPTYYSTSSDPLFTPDCTELWGTCTRSDGVGLETLQIRIPDAAQPAAGDDHHMTVVDQASGWEYDFWGVTGKPAGGGTLQVRWGGATRIDGDGRASAATAARFGNLAGIIRAQELEAGNINHALFMVIKCDNAGYVYPAMQGGTACSSLQDPEPNTNAPPMGSRFQLNMTDSEINALAVPAWKKTIFKAMAHYGMYMGDTGGGGSWGIQVESDQTYTSFGRSPKFFAFAQANGWTTTTDLGRTIYVGDFQNDVNWASKLRVVAPCVGQGTC
jgi:hypothetical protein